MFVCVTLVLGSFLGGDRPNDSPPPVRALFLGDRGHHRPAELHALLQPALLPHGIALEYTEDLDRISPLGLEGCDVLVVFANIDALPSPAEAALLDFVAAGHGLAALHCASYCFRDSEAWIALVGAQFASHGTGVFAATLTGWEHPLMRGFAGFTSFDETYVHTRHAADREVLAWRVDERGREPWTWVREHGAGRVFYTASGHDERTWENAGFQDLVARGIRWSAGSWAFPEPPPLAPLEYVEAEVPEYRPDGGQGRASLMQRPLAPADSRAYHVAPPGFEVELWAAEPDIGPAIAMSWDERGRAWLAESVDYPNERTDSGGRDRIRIAEDSDADGRADRFTFFAEELSIPTSLVHARGGLIVAQAPHVLFLEDTDGNDRADRRTVLFTGFHTSDTHAGPSNFRLGFDGWIWGTVGYAGFDGEVGGVRHRFGQGVFRFRPDGSELEFLGSTSNNTWGLGFDETGEVFVSTANHDQLNHLGLPNRVYESVTGWSGRAVRFSADYRDFHPLVEHVRQVDWHGRFTAAAGCAPYTARVFPERYWNRVAFVCEPTGHLVAESVLERSRASFVAHDGGNLFASRDEWTAPIAAEVGPDGAVWVLDWYDYVVQHNPTPRGFTTGRGGAYETPLRDQSRARIWRVFPSGARLDRPPPIRGASASELLAALEHENLRWRLVAQERIVAEERHDLVPALAECVRTARLDAIGNDPGALHALYALSALEAFESDPSSRDTVLFPALRHAAAPVRKHALRSLPRDERARDAIVAAGMLDDPDSLVRREALVALSEMPPANALGPILLARVTDPEDGRDAWLADAALAAAARNDLHVLLAAPGRVQLAAAEPSGPAPNLVPNASFEDADPRLPELPAGWRARTYSGEAEHAWVAGGRGGGRCLEVRSRTGSDTSWYADVAVEPGATYRLACWVRTEEIENVGRAFGALMNVHASPEPTVTSAVVGTSDWRPVELVFESGERERVSINCLYGGWGRSRGRAWFDDVSLTRVRDAAFAGLPRTLATAFARITHHFARRAPIESLPALFDALRQGDPELAAAIVQGLLEGWPSEPAIVLDEASRAFVGELLGQLPRARGGDLLALSASRGLALRGDFAVLIDGLHADIADVELDTAERARAARNAIASDDSRATRALVLAELTPQAAPEVVVELLEALSASSADELAAELLERWPDLVPSARAAAMRLLLRRSAWTRALLDAVAAGTVGRGELSPQDWQGLASSPDATVAARARELAASGGRTPGERIAAALARLTPAVEQRGDRERGHALFTKLCATCHRLADEGGSVGPALDGFGTRPRGEILSELVDPNRSVEATYALWVLQDTDGIVLTGRLVNESRTSIEILDSEGRSTVVPRDRIDVLRAAGTSLMPEGLLDELDLTATADLLEYVTRPR